VANEKLFNLPNEELSTQKELAQSYGITQQTMNNYMRMASMIPELEDLVDTGMVIVIIYNFGRRKNDFKSKEIRKKMEKYIWTIQSEDVLRIIKEKGCYYPDISYIKGGYKSAYKIVLDSFNNINKSEYKGIIYGFAKYGKDLYFESIDELYQYFLDNPAITMAFNKWNNQNVILQLRYEENFNMIPIDFNDFIQIMPPVWDKAAYETIVSRIERGIYEGGYTLPSFTQVHTPFIKKDNIIGIYGNFDKKASDESGVITTFSIDV